MTLEVAIQNLADAINNLAKAGGATAPSKPAKIEKTSDAGTVNSIAGAAANAVANAKTPEAPAEPVKLEYARDVRPPFLAYGKAKGRDAATALLGEFGVKAATEIAADKWPAFLARVNELSQS